MSSKARRREEDNDANGSPDKTEVELNCHPIYGDGNVCRCAAQCICNDPDQEADYRTYIYERFARSGSKYRRKKEAIIFKEITNIINLHELKSKSAPTDFVHDEMHSANHKCGPMFMVNATALQRHNNAARQRADDLMFVVIFVLLLCS